MKKKIIKKLRSWLIPKLKYWGVAFEKNLPPEFIISDHGELRLKQRTELEEDQEMKKTIVKAWQHGETKRSERDKNLYETKYAGYHFIFRKFYPPLLGGFPQKMLITIYPVGGKSLNDFLDEDSKKVLNKFKNN